jgi:hypothetical protein
MEEDHMNSPHSGWDAVDSASPIAVPDGAELFAEAARSRKARSEDEPEAKKAPARDARAKSKN